MAYLMWLPQVLFDTLQTEAVWLLRAPILQLTYSSIGDRSPSCPEN